MNRRSPKSDFGNGVWTRAIVASAALCLAACGSESSPAGGGAGGATAAMPFSTIYPMFFPNTTNARCNFCHSMPPNEVGNGKLHMGDDMMTAYEAIVGKTSISSRCMGRPLVLPGQPEMSLFYLKLTPTPPCGIRMPNGGTPFTDAQLGMVHDWIAAGAPMN